MTKGYEAFLRRCVLGLTSQTATLTQFGYDLGGRLVTVTNGNYIATYPYLTNSPRVSQLVLKSNAATRMG